MQDLIKRENWKEIKCNRFESWHEKIVFKVNFNIFCHIFYHLIPFSSHRWSLLFTHIFSLLRRMDLHWKQTFLRHDKNNLVSAILKTKHVYYNVVQFTTDRDHFISFKFILICDGFIRAIPAAEKGSSYGNKVNAALNLANEGFSTKSLLNVETSVNDTTTIITTHIFFSFFRTSDLFGSSIVTASATRLMCVFVLLKEVWNDLKTVNARKLKVTIRIVCERRQWKVKFIASWKPPIQCPVISKLIPQ